MKKFWSWLLNLFNDEEETQAHVSNEEEINAVDGNTAEHICDCDCNCTKCDCNKDEVDDFVEYLLSVDWDNLTIGTIDRLNTVDLNNYCDDLINWYKISKFKGLPDEFIHNYKDKIMWKEYNKSYLKKVTKEMLKAEGYLA